MEKLREKILGILRNDFRDFSYKNFLMNSPYLDKIVYGINVFRIDVQLNILDLHVRIQAEIASSWIFEYNLSQVK